MTIPDSIRAQVQSRAQKRCEYCKRIEFAIGFNFHIDHIIAKKHGGDDNLENLAWSCFQCNVFKGTDIASYDSVTGELTPLFNPRLDDWSTHFEIDDIVINGRTPIGRVTIHILQMNHPDQLEIRALLKSQNLW